MKRKLAKKLLVKLVKLTIEEGSNITYDFKNVLQTVPLVVAEKGVAILVMRRAPQKLLRMLIPAVFSAPGMFRQSQATVFEMAAPAAATLPQLQQP